MSFYICAMICTYTSYPVEMPVYVRFGRSVDVRSGISAYVRCTFRGMTRSMGQEISCVAHLNGHASSGTAYLDTDVLHFRGAFRLKIPCTAISALDATD